MGSSGGSVLGNMGFGGQKGCEDSEGYEKNLTDLLQNQQTGQQTQQRTQDTGRTESLARSEISPLEMEWLNRNMGLTGQLTGQNAGVQGNQSDLTNRLLTGQTLPGYYGGLANSVMQGVDADAIAGKAVQDILPTFQQGGVLDSGVAAQISANTAAGVRTNVAQQNISNRYNLLNAMMGYGLQGAGQQQSGNLGMNELLQGSFAGMRNQRNLGITSQAGLTGGRTAGYTRTSQKTASQLWKESQLQREGMGGQVGGAQLGGLA